MGVKPSITNGVRSGGSDKREGHCKICRRGIFEGEPRVWSRRPLGLVHTGCAGEVATRG